jgi:beta-fructofuranosidase
MGYMWECPDIFSLDGHDVLVMSPQGVKPEGDLYHNLHQSVYVLGDLDVNQGEFTFGNFQLLDYGFDFYAPQTTLDDKGRRVLVGWMAMWESEMPEQNDNWAGAITLPRIISIQNGQLKSLPAPELEFLRFEKVSYENNLVEKSRSLEGVYGDCLELNLVIDAKKSSEFGIKVRLNETGTEQTVLTYNVDQEVIILDRNQSGKGPGGIRKAPVALKNGQLQLHLFLDKSSLEVFLQNGEKVMSARIYPSSESTSIQFFCDETIEIVQLDKWSLIKSISDCSSDL